MISLVLSLMGGMAMSKPILEGYDMVEYFSLNPTDNGVKGNSQYRYDLTTDVGGGSKPLPANYTFYFKNAANRDMFIADPWKYVPAYGGF